MRPIEVLAKGPKFLGVFHYKAANGRGLHGRRLPTLTAVFLIIALCLVAITAGCGKDKSSSESGSPGDGAGNEPGPSPAVTEPAGGTKTGGARPQDYGSGTGEDEGRDAEGDIAMPREPVEPLEGAVLVVVENLPSARPQSGLDKADVVYEADVVAGITRFLAVYYSEGAPKIGPVRSVRKFLVEIAHAYNSPVAHAGGNADALKLIKSLKGFKDMDEIFNSGAFFWRDNTRKKPHNLYTSTNLLQKGAKKKGYALVVPPPLPTTNKETAETLSSPSAPAEEASHIRIPFSEKADTKNVVEYRFEDGAYKRFINGKPHLMRDGSPIQPENVAVLFVETKEEWGDDPQLINKVIGSGKALFFSGGRVHNGSWNKSGSRSHFVFTLNDGEPMLFLPGKTWIEIVDRSLDVTYE
ncbi:MAG TPA: DUF3048 domain-containing protein [Clostridia bacterium]|nr:DUF3048 domain-containing protein [Clostridia bacterium]